MTSEKAEHLYLDEISLLGSEEYEAYIRLNLRKILAHRREHDIPVIGIAGAEGKTTAKRMLSAILSANHSVLETPPDCSTASGVTSTLLKLNEHHEFAIIELGIVESRQFEMAVKVAEPNIAVVTNIGEAHLASLGDKHLIADAKVELVRRLPEEGFAILNIDDDLVSAMGKYSPSSKIIKFGLNKNAHFFANKIEYLGPDGIVFHVNGFYDFHLPIYGSTSIYNALAAISVARVLGFEFEEIRESLQKNFSLLEHRGNLIKHSDTYILDYTYDATINSVNKACESLMQFKGFSKKRVLVIGDINNPGPDAKSTHLAMGYYIAALPIDVVVTIGENAKYVAEGIKTMNHNKKILSVCEDNETLIESVKTYLEPESTLLFIGSRDLKLDEPLKEIIQYIS